VQNVAQSIVCDRILLKCPLDCLYFKRKRSQKVDRATFSTEWKSTFRAAGKFAAACREIAGARDIFQKFENLKKQDE
jgi:hypothetical protein